MKNNNFFVHSEIRTIEAYSMVEAYINQAFKNGIMFFSFEIVASNEIVHLYSNNVASCELLAERAISSELRRIEGSSNKLNPGVGMFYGLELFSFAYIVGMTKDMNSGKELIQKRELNVTAVYSFKVLLGIKSIRAYYDNELSSAILGQIQSDILIAFKIINFKQLHSPRNAMHHWWHNMASKDFIRLANKVEFEKSKNATFLLDGYLTDSILFNHAFYQVNNDITYHSLPKLRRNYIVHKNFDNAGLDTRSLELLDEVFTGTGGGDMPSNFWFINNMWQDVDSKNFYNNKVFSLINLWNLYFTLENIFFKDGFLYKNDDNKTCLGRSVDYVLNNSNVIFNVLNIRFPVHVSYSSFKVLMVESLEKALHYIELDKKCLVQLNTDEGTCED